MTKLIMIRGLPGSGKSTLANMLKVDEKVVHYEADMFFIDKDGNYKYDRELVKEAHQWCIKQVDQALGVGCTVIVSNTFVSEAEMLPYFSICNKYKIVPTIVTCQNNFKNVHGVPEEILYKMKVFFDHDLTDIMKDYFQ